MAYLDKLADINTSILDVDGVLTDGSVYGHADGSLQRKMNVKDGFAIKWALIKGIQFIIITGGTCEGVKKRLEGLGVQHIYLGVQNKKELFNQLVHSGLFDPHHCLYMGDDIPDLACMRHVLLPCCPADACPEVLAVSDYISHQSGGQACVRDILEKVLRVQDKWNFTDLDQ